MGEIVSIRKMSIERYISSSFAVLFCNSKESRVPALMDAGYQHFALNLSLSQALLSFPEYERSSNVRETLLSVVPKNTPVYLVDYEMLFDPRYELDVLKLFQELARRQRLIVKWCGKLVAETLIYAEPGFPEYKRYPVKDYDIICVK